MPLTIFSQQRIRLYLLFFLEQRVLNDKAETGITSVPKPCPLEVKPRILS